MDFEELQTRLFRLKKYARDEYIPIIRVESARFLYNYVLEHDYKKVLEIGTAVGYSGSIMLAANDCVLTTVEINPDSYAIARDTFDSLGYSNRVSMFLMDAKDLIADLVQKGEKFDMIFLDGPKGQYINYLPGLTKLLSGDGVIVADNVLLHGMVESSEKLSHKHRSMVMHLRKYWEAVNTEPYETELVRIEDGLAITRYRGSK